LPRRVLVSARQSPNPSTLIQQSRLDRPEPVYARSDRLKSAAIPLMPTPVEKTRHLRRTLTRNVTPTKGQTLRRPCLELGEVKLDSYAAWISILVGDLIGPYISQFLWLDIPYGIKTIDQRYRSPGPTSISLPILPPGWPANEAPSPPPSSSSTRRRGTSAGAVKLSNMCMRILAFKPM